ncbi:MAG: pyroglutamyl-peptidase I [Anaerolineae bacterium]
MRILVTGFEPFGGRSRNPSREAALDLDGVTLAGARVAARILPVDTLRAPALLDAAIAELRPDAVVCLGEAASRTRLSIERVAVNLLDFPMPDNAGYQPTDQAIVAGGPAAYFATLPVRWLREVVADEAPVELSLSAGTYLCNQIMYHVLYTQAGTGVPAGFIHLPRSFSDPDAELDNDLPQIKRGVRRLVESVAVWFGEGVPAAPQPARGSA